MEWPFMLRSTHDVVRRENYTLRDALREANNELRKHRTLLAGVRSQQPEILRKLESVLNGTAASGRRDDTR